MRDASGLVRGIRLRTAAGRKFAVRGGHEGLFIPESLEPSDSLIIAEGPSDVAALLSIGFEAVGRPSCGGGASFLVDLVRRHRPGRVVIVSDSDQAGRDGAARLACRLVSRCHSLQVIEPPAGFKDARDWVRSGVARGDVLDVIERAPVHRICVAVSERGGRHG
jgi:DNA primase